MENLKALTTKPTTSTIKLTTTTKPNACLSSPCKNGSKCRSTTGGGYICACRLFYIGKNCQTCNEHFYAMKFLMGNVF